MKVKHLGAIVLALGLVLAGCAPAGKVAGAPAAQSPSPQPSAQSTSPQPASTAGQLVAAANKEGAVTLWYSGSATMDAILKPFQDRYPSIKVTSFYGNPGAALIARMASESKAGQHNVDVVILGPEIADAVSAGLLDQYNFPNVVGWPDQPSGTAPYRAFAGEARMTAAYNTNLVTPADVPKTTDDLANAKWAGKAFWSLSGDDTPLFWAWIWRGTDGSLGWDKSFSFWTNVFKNTKPLVVNGFSGAVARMAAGEVAIFPAVGFSTVTSLITQGAPMAFVPIGPVPGDTFNIAQAKGAPHPNAAHLLIDWFTSPEGQLSYSNATYRSVLMPGPDKTARTNLAFAALGITFDPLPPSVLTSDNLKKATDFWYKTAGVQP